MLDQAGEYYLPVVGEVAEMDKPDKDKPVIRI